MTVAPCSGIVPGTLLKLYVDSSVEADVQDALDALYTQEARGGGRADEGGFAGSALVGGGRPRAAAEGVVDLSGEGNGV